MSYGLTQSTLWGPTHLTESKDSTDALEVSLHTLPKQVCGTAPLTIELVDGIMEQEMHLR